MTGRWTDTGGCGTSGLSWASSDAATNVAMFTSVHVRSHAAASPSSDDAWAPPGAVLLAWMPPRAIASLMTQAGAYCTASRCSNHELFRLVDGDWRWSGLGNPKGDSGSCTFGHPCW